MASLGVQARRLERQVEQEAEGPGAVCERASGSSREEPDGGSKGFGNPVMEQKRKVCKKGRHKRNLRKRLYEYQQGRCCWCGQPMPLPADRVSASNRMAPTFEHLHPRALGGKNRVENLLLAHLCCNEKRQHKEREPLFKPMGDVDGQYNYFVG